MAKSPRLEQTRPTGHGRARGLVSSRTSGRRIEAQTFAPSPDMAPVVASYWMGAWSLCGQPPHVTELLSDPCVHIVFETGDRGTSARVVGLWTRLWTRTLEGEGRVRGAKLRAGAVRAFVDVPAVDLANRIMPLEDAFDDVPALTEAVMASDDPRVGFGLFEDWLRAQRTTVHAEKIATAVGLVERIAEDVELTSAHQLAQTAGLSLRQLQRLFRDYVGASPKWVIRRNRLQEAALRIERGDSMSLAALAADLGYADQAHLARDFKSVVGKSPSRFGSTVK